MHQPRHLPRSNMIIVDSSQCNKRAIGIILSHSFHHYIIQQIPSKVKELFLIIPIHQISIYNPSSLLPFHSIPFNKCRHTISTVDVAISTQFKVEQTHIQIQLKNMCKHILNVQAAIRSACCKKWFDCADCHNELNDHPLKKTNELVFACKKCHKIFRKDVLRFEEADQYCPHCDNKYVLDAVTKEDR